MSTDPYFLRWDLVDNHVTREVQDYSPTPDEWPYPDIHREMTPPDSLRDAILKRLGREDGEVVIYEREISGGYSEYTQENTYQHAVRVDGDEVFQSDEYGNGLVDLLKWLDEEGN